MTFVFGQFELDPARRELRVEGKAQSIQPQVFDVLLCLVENHERVVPKRELLEALWPDTIVTESSIQRAVSWARGREGRKLFSGTVVYDAHGSACAAAAATWIQLQ
ncbi:MAG: winged helix-turn-helix domain-containing protein [Polyangiales bacterium]